MKTLFVLMLLSLHFSSGTAMCETYTARDNSVYQMPVCQVFARSDCSMRVFMPEPWCHVFNSYITEELGYSYVLDIEAMIPGDELKNLTVFEVTSGTCSAPGECFVELFCDDGEYIYYTVPVNEAPAIKMEVER